MIKHLQVPLSAEDVRGLRAGDAITLSGIIVTARDAAHKFLIETFVDRGEAVPKEEEDTYRALRKSLSQGAVYHCGPVVEQIEGGSWRIVAAGPTTSIREEKYEAEVMEHFGIRAVIGKGGMGDRTLQACHRLPAVYLHAVGGAAAAISGYVKEVLDVHKLDFGLPEAMWVLRVERLPLVVTMDSYGQSLHKAIEVDSAAKLAELMGG